MITEEYIEKARQEEKERRQKMRDAIETVRKGLDAQVNELRSLYFRLPHKWYNTFGKTMILLEALQRVASEISYSDLTDQMNLLQAEVNLKASKLDELIAKHATTESKGGQS